MEFEYIEVEKENLPYQCEMELGSELFELEFRYNELHDFFTIDLFKNEEVLVYGEKIVYGIPLFSDVYDQRFPAPTIIPSDPSGIESSVTFENLNKTVFLRVVNEE